MPYLNVDEVESALSVAASAPFTAFTQLITLPELTWEGRQCHTIKIANGGGPGRPGVYFLGGVHAREWGSSDILINFVEQLEQAYLAGTGLAFGPKSFSPTDIQTIVNTLDVVVFPQANPDGRNYSMTVDAMWRKNRRTAAPNTNSGSCVGVDINRNYDFLWDFPTYYDPTAPIVDSTNPCDYQLYNGPSAFSEPESRNAKSIFDTFPNIRFFIDLHSYSEDILYSWGDDDDQTTDPNMNFQNPTYNGLRGITDGSGLPNPDAYKEYIPSCDLSSAINLANTFRDGIQAVRGTTYTVKSSVDLYPTAGTSDDYAYSRNFVDSSKQKVLAYVLEWGTEFQPPYSEMQNIIQEITAGLLDFCLGILAMQIKWANPPDIVYGTPLGPAQLNATAPVPGTFTYSPPAGTCLPAGPHTLSVTFTPNDPTCPSATATVPITVQKATPIINWSNPPDIDFGTPLDNTQLDASATWVVCGNPVTVAGTFIYTPGAGTVLPVGTQTLCVSFTPTDTANYNNANACVQINVLTGHPIILSCSFAPTTLQWEERVQAIVLLKNDSVNSHGTQGPDPGFEYSEGDTYQTKGFPSVAGAYRVGVDLDETTYTVAKLYRWGFGHTLAPGEVVSINGYIRFHNSRHNGHYYVALLQEANQVLLDHQCPTLITVERP